MNKQEKIMAAFTHQAKSTVTNRREGSLPLLTVKAVEYQEEVFL